MSTHTKHGNLPSLYYITFTCRHWLPLIDLVNEFELVYSWFEFLKENYSIKTTSYVIMPIMFIAFYFFQPINMILAR